MSGTYDYISKYNDIIDKAKIAAEQSTSHPSSSNISSQLGNSLTLLKEVQSDSSLVNSKEEGVQSFITSLTSLVSTCQNVKDFLDSDYSEVENTYVNLDNKLTELKKLNDELNELDSNKPILSNYVLSTPDDDEFKAYDFKYINKYRRDLNKWETDIGNYKSDCESLQGVIDELISYLDSVNGADPSEGATDISKPTTTFTIKSDGSVEQANNKALTEKYGIDRDKMTKLSDEEINEYFDTHYSALSRDDVGEAYKVTVNIKGTDFDVYVLYDKRKVDIDGHYENFEQYIARALEKESDLDSSILSAMGKAGVEFSFIDVAATSSAVTELTSLNVRLYYDEEFDCINENSIIHETGHVLDVITSNYFLSRYDDYPSDFASILNEYTSSDKPFVALNISTILKSVLNKYSENSELVSELYPTNEDGKSLSLADIYDVEAVNFDEVLFETGEGYSGITFSGGMTSVYDVDSSVREFGYSYEEYFADAFRAYYFADDKELFKETCPYTYAYIENVVNFINNHYEDIGTKMEYINTEFSNQQN